jgi:phosphate-selective porin
MIEKWDFLKFKVGQWKTYYNRERVISSGEQQLVDRSILTRPFTLDRQQGVEFYGRILPGSPTDFTYHVSMLTGTGRGNTTNDDNRLMYVGRLQWNVFGRELAMTGSDLAFHEEPTGLIAGAAVNNQSPYTRFSQSGGGQLEGYSDGEPGQYQVSQWMIETAFMWRGFSWQQEYHRKYIWNRLDGNRTTLSGNYVQAGYFLANLWSWFPPPLEVAARYAYYRPEVDETENLEQEFGVACNWFFAEHRNKLTAEVTYFSFQDTELNQYQGTRFRLQWDISF